MWQSYLANNSELRPPFYWSYLESPSEVRGQTWVMEPVACSDCNADLLTCALSKSASGSIAWQVEVTAVNSVLTFTALKGILLPCKRTPGRGPLTCGINFTKFHFLMLSKMCSVPLYKQICVTTCASSVSWPRVVSSAWPGRIFHYLLFIRYSSSQRKWEKWLNTAGGTHGRLFLDWCHPAIVGALPEWPRDPQGEKPSAPLRIANSACRPGLMKDRVCKGETKAAVTSVGLKTAALHCKTFPKRQLLHEV